MYYFMIMLNNQYFNLHNYIITVIVLIYSTGGAWGWVESAFTVLVLHPCGPWFCTLSFLKREEEKQKGDQTCIHSWFICDRDLWTKLMLDMNHDYTSMRHACSKSESTSKSNSVIHDLLLIILIFIVIRVNFKCSIQCCGWDWETCEEFTCEGKHSRFSIQHLYTAIRGFVRLTYCRVLLAKFSFAREHIKKQYQCTHSKKTKQNGPQ